MNIFFCTLLFVNFPVNDLFFLYKYIIYYVLMLDELLIFLGIGIISLGISGFLLSDRAGVVKPIAMRLFFIGVIFHELAHYVSSLAVGEVPNGMSVKWYAENKTQRFPNGSVSPSEPPSFLQSIVIAFAPLYISTWLIFLLVFGVIFTPMNNVVLKVISVFLVLSLLLTAAPSAQDIRMIGYAFQKDPQNSWYQILLILVSILILWAILLLTRFTFILDVFYYFAIAGIYLLLKFSVRGIGNLIERIFSHNYTKPSKTHPRAYTRKRYRPKKTRADCE